MKKIMYKKYYHEYKNVIMVILSNAIFSTFINDIKFYNSLIKILSIIKYLEIKIYSNLNNWWAILLNINVVFNTNIKLDDMIDERTFDLKDELDNILAFYDVLLFNTKKILFTDLSYNHCINNKDIVPVITDYTKKQATKVRSDELIINKDMTILENKVDHEEVKKKIIYDFSKDMKSFSLPKKYIKNNVAWLFLVIRILLLCTSVSLGVLYFFVETSNVLKIFSISPIFISIYYFFNLSYLLHMWKNPINRFQIEFSKNNNNNKNILNTFNSQHLIMFSSLIIMSPCFWSLVYLNNFADNTFLWILISLCIFYILTIIGYTLLLISNWKYTSNINYRYVYDLYYKYCNERLNNE